MPITLQDAIERTKLSADDSNYISQELFDQFLQALNERDRHAYVTSLVQLGIMAKYSKKEDELYMRNIISRKDYDVTDEFLKFAQQDEDSDVYEGLDIDWEEEELNPYDKTMLMDKGETNPTWPVQDTSAGDGPLWPQSPGQVYTDESQSQLEYDPDMDLSVDPEMGYDQTQITQQTYPEEPEGFWPSQPGMVYTDQGQTEEEYDPEMDLSLDPSVEETGPNTRNIRKKQQSVVDSLIKAAQAILDVPEVQYGDADDEQMFEGLDDSLYNESGPFYGRVTDPEDQDDLEDLEESDPGYEILEERYLDQEPSEMAPGESEVNSMESDEDLRQAEEFLIEKNIKVNEDGTVTFHQGSSGIQGEGVANLSYLLDPNVVTSMPIDRAMKFFQQGYNSANRELSRLGELQDSLSGFSKTLDTISDDIFTTMEKLEGTLEILSKFKYNERSTDDSISTIAKGLNDIKGGLQNKINELSEFSEEFSAGSYQSYLEPVKNLQAMLDEYKGSQYDKAKDSEEILKALEIVSRNVSSQKSVEASLLESFFNWRD